MTIAGKEPTGIPTYVTGGTLIRLRMGNVPVESKRRVVGSHTQHDLARACTEDFALRCLLETSGSAHRVEVLEHLYNLSVH